MSQPLKPETEDPHDYKEPQKAALRNPSSPSNSEIKNETPQTHAPSPNPISRTQLSGGRELSLTELFTTSSIPYH